MQQMAYAYLYDELKITDVCGFCIDQFEDGLVTCQSLRQDR